MIRNQSLTKVISGLKLTVADLVQLLQNDGIEKICLGSLVRIDS
jgi:hypothetical protein